MPKSWWFSPNGKSSVRLTSTRFVPSSPNPISLTGVTSWIQQFCDAKLFATSASAGREHVDPLKGGFALMRDPLGARLANALVPFPAATCNLVKNDACGESVCLVE